MTQKEISNARKDIWNSIYTAVDMSYYIGEGLTLYKGLPEEDGIDRFKKDKYKMSINDNINREITAEAQVLEKLKLYIHDKTARTIILDHFNAACNRNFRMGLIYDTVLIYDDMDDATEYNELDESYNYNMRELHKEIEGALNNE